MTAFTIFLVVLFFLIAFMQFSFVWSWECAECKTIIDDGTFIELFKPCRYCGTNPIGRRSR